MKRLIIFVIIAFCSVVCVGQSGEDVSLAFSYYNNHEYDKAAFLFDKLYSQSKSRSYFNYYINCLLNTSDFDKAEKAAKKQVSSNRTDMAYKVILGNVYKQSNQTDKAAAQFDEIVSTLPSDKNRILQISNQFLSISEPDWSEKVLLKGQELTGQSFTNELFSVYASSRNFKKMADSGLDLIGQDYTNITRVQSMFQYYVNSDVNDEFYDILRQSLLKRVQESPTQGYSEMLVWLFVQKKNFKSALIQAKALDKRLGEQGQRLINLGDQALAAKDYQAASDCYKYVLAKGKDNPYYSRANFGILTSMYEQVSNGTITDQEQIRYLETQYNSTFSEFPFTNKIVNEVINYANLETYFLNKPDSAISVIERMSQVNNLSYTQRAQLNLELGDVQLFKDDVWAAVMTYAKVENDNKQNELGDEAKFRKAKIAYYTGNFKWAASQLDVLKAATTKLVANDAMALSLVISDNVDRENSVPGDTLSAIDEDVNSSVDLRIYARADMYFVQKQYDKSSASLDSIITMYKESGLVDDALYLKAQICERRQDYQNAADYYRKVADDYSYDLLADKAAYNYAEVCANHLNDPETAKTYYMKILSDYPGSIYAVEAREKYRALSGK